MVELLWRCFCNLKPNGKMFIREITTTNDLSKMGDYKTSWYNRYCPKTIAYILSECGFCIISCTNLQQLTGYGDDTAYYNDVLYVIVKKPKFRR